MEKTLLIELMGGIQKFSKEVWKGSTLDYCVNRDSFHIFTGERCLNCSGFESEKINTTEYPRVFEFKELKNYFGNNFSPKLKELLDDWPKKNGFPFIHNPRINQIEEHKKLKKLYLQWDGLGEEEKFNQIFDFQKTQEEFQSVKEEYNKYTELLSID